MGTIDVPTFIDYVLATTGLQKLAYVGHSEGTTQMFMGSSLMPKYFASKVNIFIALAPVARLAGVEVTGGTKVAVEHLDEVALFLTKVGYYNTIAPMPTLSEGAILFCSTFKPICESFVDKIALNPEVNNKDRIQEWTTIMPAGASYRTFIFYG